MTYCIRLLTFLVGMMCVQAMAYEVHRAAQQGNGAQVMAAIDAGTAVDALDGDGKSLLWVAAQYGQVELVKLLLDAGANPTLTGNSAAGSLGTPLHAAIGRNHIETVRVLLEAGMDPNMPDAGVGPPLHAAMKGGYTEIIGLLLDAGAQESATAASVSAQIASADLELGRKISGTCTGCHQLAKGEPDTPKLGPTLWNILNRSKASVSGYAYSEALKASDGVWDYDELNNLLAAPRSFLPGTKMDFFTGIQAPDRRAAIIAYLRTYSDDPAPLP